MFVRRIATPRNANQIQRNFVRFFADPRPSNPGGAGAAAAGSKYGVGAAAAPAQGSGQMADPVEGTTSSFSGYGNNSFAGPTTASSGKDSGFSASSASANNYSGSSGPSSSSGFNSSSGSSGSSSSSNTGSGHGHSSSGSSGNFGGSGTMMKTNWSNYALIGSIIAAPLAYFYYTKNRRHGMAKETEQAANRTMPIESKIDVRQWFWCSHVIKL